MSENYKARKFSRVAQRFVCPIYKKDGLGGFYFSSTITFVKYKSEFFCIFAAHALDKSEIGIENFGVFAIDGSFISLAEITHTYKIYTEYDIVICNTIYKIEDKNYFDIEDIRPSKSFKENGFAWIGFPQAKAVKNIHKTKSTKPHIAQYVTHLSDGTLKWENAKFLLLGSELYSKTSTDLIGKHDNENVTYEHEGYKHKGYSLRGMSGGAFFHVDREINFESPEIDSYFFAGIGLEYNDRDKVIKGRSRSLILNLIIDFLGS
ncbi:hypothetical protein [Cellvibrio polysaccharolyticus]|uniref:Uncharacterized protein n=1 Tax=Cellvibrio polysaccharolyticus TaxID=2082724 RepID=A0A928V343_9GAMM|nr:hypothetical protein [Cellvibrio polysaccharolyticus]MBE8715764.1 hypothetical protein [Cellvibrio polysaccharolyticus]